MNPNSTDLAAIQHRLQRARNPKAAAKADAEQATAKAEKHAAGQEKSLQDAIQQFAEMKGCYVLRARMDRKSTLNHAHPDLTIWAGSRCCAVEVKAQGGRLSAEQAQAIHLLFLAGCPVEVCWNLKQACDFIIRHLFTP